MGYQLISLARIADVTISENIDGILIERCDYESKSELQL